MRRPRTVCQPTGKNLAAPDREPLPRWLAQRSARMSPNVLIAGWAGSGNLGDELICGSLADLLRQRGAEVAMFSEDPSATETLHGVRAFPTRSLRKPRRWADAVVLGPGGLLQDQTSAISCAVHLGRFAAIGAARARAGIGLGVGPIDRWPSRWTLRAAALTQPRWIVRDRPSRSTLQALGFRRVEVAPDLAHLALAVPDGHEGDHVVNRVVIAPRGTTANCGERAGELAAAIEASRIGDRLEVTLLAMTAEDEAVAGEAIDLLAARSARRLPSLFRPTLAQASSLLGPGDYAITARFHVGLMANRFGNGWFAIGSGHKMASFANDCGVSTYAETEAGLTRALTSVPEQHTIRPQVPPASAFEPIGRTLDGLIARANRGSR